MVLNWLWAYLTYRRGTRLITGNTMDVCAIAAGLAIPWDYTWLRNWLF